MVISGNILLPLSLWVGVEYAHRIPACRMRRLNGCPDDIASTAWDYVCLLCNHYRDAGPKRCHYSQTSRAQSPLNPLYTWSNMLLTGLHHSPVVSIPLLLPWNPCMLPLHLPPLLFFLRCTRVRENHHHMQTVQSNFRNILASIFAGLFDVDYHSFH